MRVYTKTRPYARAGLKAAKWNSLVLVSLAAVGCGKQALAHTNGLRRDLDELVVLNVLQSLFEGERHRRG